MSNEKICNIICGVGCAIIAWHSGLMFFGLTGALRGAIVGLLIVLFGYFFYE